MSRIVRHFSPEPIGPGVRVALGLGSHHIDKLEELTNQAPFLGYCFFTDLLEYAGKEWELSGLQDHIITLEIQEDLFTNQPYFQDKQPFRIVRAQTDLSWEDYNALYRVRRRKERK